MKCIICSWPSDRDDIICTACYTPSDSMQSLLVELAGSLKRQIRHTQEEVARINHKADAFELL